MKEAIEILSKGVDRRVGAVRVEGKPALGHHSIPDPIHHSVDGIPNTDGNMVRWSFLEVDSGVTSVVNRMKIEGKFSWIRGQLKYTFLGISAVLGWKKQSGWIKIDNNPGEVIELSDSFVFLNAKHLEEDTK